jgi:hypothetical protein
MTTVEDFVAGGSAFSMPVLQEFTRRRAAQIADPYDLESTVEDWEHSDEVTLRGFISSQTSTEQADPVRSQLITTKQLIIPDPGADIRRGDLVLTSDGGRYRVQGLPSRDRSPFTGWEPITVVNLEEAKG